MRYVLPFFLFVARLVSTATTQKLNAEDWFSKGAAFEKAKKYDKMIEACSKALTTSLGGANK